jgi:hypothetical protein
MDVDDSISLIDGIPKGILDEQLRPHPIHLLNIFIIIIMLNFILLELPSH